MTVSEASGSVRGGGGGGDEVSGYRGLPLSCRSWRSPAVGRGSCWGDRAWEKSQCPFWKFPGRFHTSEINPSSSGVANKL